MNSGTLIAGRYRIVHLLGRGGMGAVYKAVDQQTDRARAVKLMLDHRVDDAEARARFEREARMAGHINSPFIVDVIDAGVDAATGTPYLVMELLEGENLEQRLDRLGPRPPAEVVEHLGQVARALSQMHASGVVHRDLKPSNLFVEEGDGAAPRIKVLDLGVVKVLSMTGGDTTAVVGSVPYMAPEQIHGRAIGPATDLYALGLIAFTLLTGSAYWAQGRDEQAIALAMRIADGPQDAARARAREAGAELAPAFDAWFAQATARRPAKRFRSAVEAVLELAASLGVEPPPWLEDEPAPGPAERAHDPDPDPPDDAPPRAAAGETTSTAGGPDLTPLPRLASASTVDPHLPPALVPSPEPAEPVPPRWRRAAALSVGALGATALAAGALWPRSSGSPLAKPAAVLACPILEVDGAAAEWGWLGAAAGSLACERARILLGGAASRTRVPAELLDLRRAMDFDDDPYAAPGARAASLEAARRADAYLDGRIVRLGAGGAARRFQVDLVLRRPDATELAHARGEGAALYQAVRAAMDGLVAPGALPLASRIDPAVADYQRAGDVATLLGLMDLKLATVNHAADLQTECARFAGADAATDLASFARYLCKYTLGYPRPEVVPPAGTTPGAKVARARVEHMAHGRDDPAAIDELRRLYGGEASAWGRSTIAATLSCLLEGTADKEALEWALKAVENEPKNPSGEWCGPWGQLSVRANDTTHEAQVSIDWRAWAPWEAYAWWFAARNTRRAGRALIYAERAYVLSPLDTNMAGELSNRLLRLGRGARVEAIARQLGDSPHPVHQILSTLLAVRYHASEGRFGRAIELARPALPFKTDDAGWVAAQRIELSWRAVEIANVLGRASELADAAVAELLDRTPPALDWKSFDTPRHVAAICAYASAEIAQRCFARWHDEMKSQETAAFADGARLFAAGDLRGAAGRWRPLVRDAAEHVGLLAESMVRAYAAADEPDLAIQLEARTRDHTALFDGASMAMARAAQAARAHGDRAEAARLAKRVYDAWVNADPSPPILDEMRRLISQP